MGSVLTGNSIRREITAWKISPVENVLLDPPDGLMECLLRDGRTSLYGKIRLTNRMAVSRMLMHQRADAIANGLDPLQRSDNILQRDPNHKSGTDWRR